MIVKNEEKIICRLLDSVCSELDAIAICDTGSTDNTAEVVRTHIANTYPLVKLHWFSEPFKNFEYNRNFSLKGCVDFMKTLDVENNAYILFMDADMTLRMGGGKGSLRQYLNDMDDVGTNYNLFQGSDTYFYKNIRLLHKSFWESRYCGVTHEYLAVDLQTVRDIPRQSIFIVDIGDGGAKSNKCDRDISLLLDDLEKDPTNERYMFYLANSLRDAGQYQDAIKWFEFRIQAGGWYEEIWHSYYDIGKCYASLGEHEKAVEYWWKAFDYNQYRIENMYEIVKYYCRVRQYARAYYIYEIVQMVLRNRPQDEGVLFFNKKVYDYLLDFEMSIMGNYYNPAKMDIMGLYMKLLACPTLDSGTEQNLLSNLKFECGALIDIAVSQKGDVDLAELLHDFPDKIIDPAGDYVCSTPTVLYVDDIDGIILMLINVRYVNYRIDSVGGYVHPAGFIGTVNLLHVYQYEKEYDTYCWKKTKDNVIKYNTAEDNDKGGYVGLEDIRLLCCIDDAGDGKFLYSCNRGLLNGKIGVQYGEVLLNIPKGCFEYVESPHNADAELRDVEKNWAFFNGEGDVAMYVYSWGESIVIKSLTGDKHTIAGCPPFFRHLRGSTNGVEIIKGEIWFICHMVSFEERRRYYHIFVVLDADTYAVKKYSKLWTFEKQPVEYCLSFLFDADMSTMQIPYSVGDCNKKCVAVSFDYIKSLMICHHT